LNAGLGFGTGGRIAEPYQATTSRSEHCKPIFRAAGEAGRRDSRSIPSARRRIGDRCLGQQNAGMIVARVAVEADDHLAGCAADINIDRDLVDGAAGVGDILERLGHARSVSILPGLDGRLADYSEVQKG
jgi:hypothetical protein